MYFNFFHADSYSYTSFNCDTDMNRNDILHVAKRTGLNIDQIIDAIRELKATPLVMNDGFAIPNNVSKKTKTGSEWDIRLEDDEKPEDEGFVDMFEESGALEAMEDMF